MNPQQLIETALAAADSEGTTVIVRQTGEANIRWANNTVTTNGVSQSLQWSVISTIGGAASAVTGSVIDAADTRSIAELVRRSEDAARAAAAAGAAPDRGELVGGGVDADFDEPAVVADFATYDRLIPQLAGAFQDARSSNEVLYGFARHELATSYLGSSTGLRRRWVQPTGTLELNAKSADLARSSWAGTSTADFTDVDLTAMAADLHTRLGWANRSLELPPGRYDTVLPPTSVADFMVHLAWSAGARPAYQGRSAFSSPGGGTRIGERLTDLPLSLYADPTEPGIEAAPFVLTTASSDQVSVFDNGAPIGRTELVTDGVISGLEQTRGSAAEYGAPFTPLADNLVLTGHRSEWDVADLVAGLDRGLLLTSLWYLREVDPMTMLLTGLTRDGVFLVEQGEIVGAVNNFRFNVSPLELLRQAEVVGGTRRALSREWSDWFTRSAMPPIRMAGFNMSSVSKAR